jgi:hypothetical protein
MSGIQYPNEFNLSLSMQYDVITIMNDLYVFKDLSSYYYQHLNWASQTYFT